MFIIASNNYKYVDCSTKFDKDYSLISITHNIKFGNSLLSISFL